MLLLYISPATSKQERSLALCSNPSLVRRAVFAISKSTKIVRKSFDYLRITCSRVVETHGGNKISLQLLCRNATLAYNHDLISPTPLQWQPYSATPITSSYQDTGVTHTAKKVTLTTTARFSDFVISLRAFRAKPLGWTGRPTPRIWFCLGGILSVVLKVVVASICVVKLLMRLSQ